MICRHLQRALMSVILAVLSSVIWAAGVGADSMPPHINRNSYTFRYEPGIIKAQVLDDTKVSGVTLFYRKPGEVDYNSIEMKRNQDTYYRNLRRELGVKGTIEYYLLAQDTSGNQTTEPVMDPEENPLNAAMDEMVNTSADEVVLSSPEPGTLIVTGNQMVIVTFYKTDRQVDMRTVRIKIDDRDRTREADIVGNVVMWEPRRPLRDGTHVIEIYANDTDGGMVGPNIWSFRVKTRLELPMGMTGNFYMGLQHDDRSDDSTNVPLWNNKIDMGLQGEQDWLSWEAGVMFSSEESSFLTSEDLEERQPINRYFLNANTRHWRLRFGDSNPNFSELSLKGILVRGFNVQFKSNRFNAQAVYGYNKRDIGENVIPVINVSNVTATTYIDDETNETVDIATRPLQEIVQDSDGIYQVYEFSPGTFKRQVAALRFDTVPIKSNFLNWDFGVNLFSAEDDTTTLDDVFDAENNARNFVTNIHGSNMSFATGYSPKKNWVGTFETSMRILNRTMLSAEFGSTIATENMYGIVTEEIKEEIPDEIPADVFPINGSTQTSFNKVQLKEGIGKGIKDIFFSVYKFRLISPLPIPKTRTSIKAEAYRIPTHYISLGNPHQKTDVGGFKVNLKTRFLQDQVSLNLVYNTYADNLDNESLQYANTSKTKQKDLTKDTNIASFSVNLKPKIYPQYAPNLSIGYRTYTAANDLDLRYNFQTDDLGNKAYSDQVDMATNTLMFSAGGTLPFGLQRHNGTLSITNMEIADERKVLDYQRNDSNNLTVLVNVSSSINPLPLTINASVGRTGNTTYTPNADLTGRDEILTGINMVNLSGAYKWFRDKRLKTTVALGFIGSANDESGTAYEVDNSKISIRFEADYKISRMASVGGMIKYIKFTDNVNAGSDYTEPILGLNLRSNF